MHRSRLTAITAVLLAVSGCVAEPDINAGPDGRLNSLAGTQWRLETIGGAPAPAEAWIGFESDSRAGGSAGCNRFGAAYRYDRPALSIEPMEMTEMACPEPRMTVEAAFIGALRETRRAGASAERLVLIAGDDTVLAIFTRRGAD